MELTTSRSRAWRQIRGGFLAICCALVLVPRGGALIAQEKTQPPQPPPAPTGTAEPAAAKLPPEQLDSLVAPIALYPDALLAQVLVASTYPLEIIQLQQWLAKNPDLKDEALTEAVAKQPWDPSIQSMAAVPDVVKRLADDIQWTTDLGNAVLAQQADVMDACQRMRKKAADTGALKTNEQQKVETKVVEEKTVIVVESANPEVIYVPSYSPTVVYGPPVYPYPPIYYPYYPPGAAFVSFSIGVMWGAAWGGSCCHCGWGGNDIDINVDNNFNRNNINSGNRGGGGNWQHNPQHRGGAPYSDKATANKYGGSARGDSLSSRQASAGNRAGGTGASASNRAGGASASTANRGGGASASTANRAGSASVSDRSAGGAASRAGSDRVGSQNIPKSSGSKAGGFGGSSGGYSGSSARASSSRGASSMGSRGGASRGGGGRRR